MPNPTVLYVIAALVFVGLFTWVGLVLKNYPTPWEAPPTARKPKAEPGKADEDGDEDEDAKKKDPADEAAKPGG